MTQQMPSSARGWLVTVAAVGINLMLGMVYAWGVMAKALAMQWHWSKTQVAMPFTVGMASFAVMMVFAGRMQDKLGPRLVALLGGVMFGLGLIASAFADSPTLMVISFGLLGGAGIGLGYSATTPPAIKWFPPARKGLITGLVVAGVGLAAVYAGPLTQYLLKATDISKTFLILGIGALAVICILSQFLRNPPAGYIPAPAAAASAARPAAVARVELDWHEMLRSGGFYRLWLMFTLSASAGLMIIAHVSIIAKEQAAWEWGFVPIMLLAIFNTAGRIVGGYVSDRIGRSRTMTLAFLLQAANMLAFAHYTSPALLVFGSALTGLCYGAIFTLMPAATADGYGVRNLGVNYGLVFTAFGVAAVLGPMVAGKIRDRTGAYTLSYAACAVMLVIAAAMAITSRKRPAAAPAPAPDREGVAREGVAPASRR